MKTNLKWIEQEWKRFIETEEKRLGVKDLINFETKEYIAKLFAAFCIERLYMENEVDKIITGE